MKKRFSCLLILLISIFAFSITSYAETIRICNSCGYELTTPAARFCSNCGAAANGSTNANTESNQENDLNEESNDTDVSSNASLELSAQEISALPLGETDFDIIKSAISFYIKKANSHYLFNSNKSLHNCLIAYYYLIEADGLLKLLPQNDALVQKTSKQIATTKREILSILPRDYTVDCPKCNGEGYIDFLYLTNDNKIEKKAKSVECPLCKTRKRYPYVLDRATLNRIVTQAKFEVYKQKEANEFAQAIIDKQITTTRPTVPQKAAYNKATALPCDQCFGFRVERCRKCNGLGLTKCNYNDCENGYKKNKKTTSNGRNNVKRIETLSKLQPCDECDGVAYVRCEECLGKGAMLCSRCHGTGSKEICNRCDGVGYSECTRCKKYINQPDKKKRSCTACNDSMLILCKACDGAGVK